MPARKATKNPFAGASKPQWGKLPQAKMKKRIHAKKAMQFMNRSVINIASVVSSKAHGENE